MRQPDPQHSSFLPDFCGARTVFVVILVAELLAIVLTLAQLPVSGEHFVNLALYSLFIQWVALSCTSILCVFRQHLNTLDDHKVAFISYLITLVTTFIVAELTWWMQSSWSINAGYFPYGHSIFLLQVMGISAIVWALSLRYFYVQFQLRLQIEAEAESRFLALQSRIKPHFLFNCMNTIASLIRRDPVAAEQSIEDLSDLFRVSLQDAHTVSTLGDELMLCRGYVRMEQQRLGDRLTIKWQLDNLPETLNIPPLILQPLLENAIYHGIEHLAEGGLIRIWGETTDAYLQIHIENPVPEEQKKTAAKIGHQIAQDNVQQRLMAYFHEPNLLQVEAAQNKYHITVRIPRRNENTNR